MPGVNLRRSMKSSTWPSLFSIAKACGNGVCGTSEPRMFKSQAINSGSVSMAASVLASRRDLAMRSRFDSERFARVFERLGGHGAQGCRGLIVPGGVERIVRARNKRGAGFRCGGVQGFDTGGRVQPGVVGELRAFRQICRDPIGRRFVDERAVLERLAVDLFGGLHGVAAVGEDRGLVEQHDGGAGGAGEARQIGEPVGARGHVLALILVGAGDDETVEAAALQLGAQARRGGAGLGSGSWIRRRIGIWFGAAWGQPIRPRRCVSRGRLRAMHLAVGGGCYAEAAAESADQVVGA